jgi:hypothetical protein
MVAVVVMRGQATKGAMVDPDNLFAARALAVREILGIGLQKPQPTRHPLCHIKNGHSPLASVAASVRRSPKMLASMSVASARQRHPKHVRVTSAIIIRVVIAAGAALYDAGGTRRQCLQERFRHTSKLHFFCRKRRKTDNQIPS